ncbi:MAG TPA: hypothetical protein VFW87_02765 [Pirellulales bacterium]|nr:hypothetical protein [Pirellulales bacterium]
MQPSVSRATAALLLRLVGALAMVGVVHAFMVGFRVPRPAAWYLGAMMYAGLVAVLFARRSLADKLGIYFVFLVVAVVGALTVCPCTSAHFFFGPLAGLLAVAVVHRVKLRLATLRHVSRSGDD